MTNTGPSRPLRRKTAPSAPLQEQRGVWPDIDRKFRIPDNDYAKTYGYWRGSAYDKVAPVEAARKFVSSEAQMRMMERRNRLHGERAAGSGPPLAYLERDTGPIKMARGEPVAQDILPFSGERALRSLVGLPTHRCHHAVVDEEMPRYSLDSGSEREALVEDVRDPAQASGQVNGDRQRLSRMALRRMPAALQSHAMKPRCYSETENLWKAPEFSDVQIKARVFDQVGYAGSLDGTLVTVQSDARTGNDFDNLTVRELVGRWSPPGRSQGTSRRLTSASSSRLPSREKLRSSASSRRPAWAKAERTNSIIIGDPSNASSTCIIQPEDPADEKLDTFTRLPDNWMGRVPNLGRVKDPFCVHLASEPLYCFNLHQARHERELHNQSSLGVYRGGPVYNINFSQAIQK